MNDVSDEIEKLRGERSKEIDKGKE